MLAICNWEGLSNPVAAGGESANPGRQSQTGGEGPRLLCPTSSRRDSMCHCGSGERQLLGAPVLNVRGLPVSVACNGGGKNGDKIHTT